MRLGLINGPNEGLNPLYVYEVLGSRVQIVVEVYYGLGSMGLGLITSPNEGLNPKA